MIESGSISKRMRLCMRKLLTMEKTVKHSTSASSMKNTHSLSH